MLALALSFAAGRLIGGSWGSALTVLLGAGLARVALLHHVTWRVNSLCHVIGQRPFRTRRHHGAANLWPLSLLSFGESRPSLYRADPTCARHGVDRGRSGPPAAVIRLFERASTGSGTCAGLPRTVSQPAACEPERPHPLQEFP
ncbi:hypothetical protein [Streptomyces sviceus]|uniref:hypothetical protein n=1 Tax=Streptomyces sviceus TaxID=285530 RepID=UPI0036ED3130